MEQHVFSFWTKAVCNFITVILALRRAAVLCFGIRDFAFNAAINVFVGISWFTYFPPVVF
jgi:hypothetical protein